MWEFREVIAVAKVLIVTGDAAESLEVMYPYQRLLEEGYEVDIAAPTKKKLQFVVHDFVDGFDTYTEKPGYTWPADLTFADVDQSCCGLRRGTGVVHRLARRPVCYDRKKHEAVAARW